MIIAYFFLAFLERKASPLHTSERRVSVPMWVRYLTSFEFASQIKFISNPSNKKQLPSQCSEGPFALWYSKICLIAHWAFFLVHSDGLTSPLSDSVPFAQVETVSHLIYRLPNILRILSRRGKVWRKKPVDHKFPLLSTNIGSFMRFKVLTLKMQLW